MDSMVKDKNNSDKGSNDREPNEILELLKTFYHPDAEQEKAQDFPDFFSQIEAKLEKSSSSNKISESANELEHLYLERQQRLEQFLRRMEENNFNPLSKIKKKSPKKTFLHLALTMLVLFLGIYFFKNYQITKKPQQKTIEEKVSPEASPAEN